MNTDLIKAFTKVSRIININCCTGKNIESLNNLHIEINKTIESLKCCGNCDLENMWYGESECNHRSDCNKCHNSAKESFWQPIN